MTKRGVALPLEGRSTTTRDDRFEKGLAVQKQIFGGTIDAMFANTPEDLMHITRSLSSYCFGGYYTRVGLDLKRRELLTFAMLLSLGGCDSQVKAQPAAT